MGDLIGWDTMTNGSATTSTITISGSGANSWGYGWSPGTARVRDYSRPESNLEWLDRRVEEMRVAL